MGIDLVIVSFVHFANEMPVQDSLFWDQDLAAEVFRETAARAREHNITVELPPLPRDDGHRRHCHEPWQFVQIDTDGSIRFCYRAWLQTVGQFDDGFDAIWRGDDYARIRQTLHTDNPHFPYCAFCSACNGTNNEAAHNQKLHADAYKFADGSSDLEFNRRTEENRLSLKARKQQFEPETSEEQEVESV
jgi:hypothetical protein